MKRILAVLLSAFLLFSFGAVTAFAEEEIKVIINGETLVTDVPAQTIAVYNNGEYVGDRVMLPVRAISEKINCDVNWNQQTKGITLYRNNNLYVMWVEKATAFHIAGASLEKGYKMDVPPTIIDNRTLIPVRAVAELLGAEVNWIGETKTVDIKYNIGQIEENSGVAAELDVYQLTMYNAYFVYEKYVDNTMEAVTGKFVLENGEEIKFELYTEIAAETCRNFIELAKSGFYNNTIFHRVIKDFVMQGGGYSTEDEYKDSESIYGEFLVNGYFNLIPHKRGTLSLARTDDYCRFTIDVLHYITF